MSRTDIRLSSMSVRDITTLNGMARWAPGTPERLQAAAFELFAAQGFDKTTAAEIAQAAGLNQRTFFRHFGDKREVVFYGQDVFVQAFVSGVQAGPPGAEPMELVAYALASGSLLFTNGRRPHSRIRQSVINSNPALQERERHKLAEMALAVAKTMRARGVTDPAATLAAESAVTVFSVAFAQWIRASNRVPLAIIAGDVLSVLRTISAGTNPAGGSG
jgi:AcrR family transcriptional regulator